MLQHTDKRLPLQMPATRSIPEILSNLSITALNPMQEAAGIAIHAKEDVLLLSPTGSGKTLAFLLPIAELLQQGEE